VVFIAGLQTVNKGKPKIPSDPKNKIQTLSGKWAEEARHILIVGTSMEMRRQRRSPPSLPNTEILHVPMAELKNISNVSALTLTAQSSSH
jgi:hypothetical protein